MKKSIEIYYRTISRQITINLLTPVIILLLSFKPDDSNGALTLPVIRKEFKIERIFQSIRLEGDISVVLTNDPAGTVIIEGIEKDLRKIKPVFENSILIIDVNRKHLFSKLTLYLSAITLQTIQLNGDGNIFSNDCIKSDNLHITLNGTINVKVRTMGKLIFDTTDEIELLQRLPSTKRKK